MLPLKYRLSLRSEKDFFSKAKRKSFSNLVFFTVLADSESDQDPQFAVIVPKKVARTAIQRNAWKRKLRNLAYQELKDLKSLKTVIYLHRLPRDKRDLLSDLERYKKVIISQD